MAKLKVVTVQGYSKEEAIAKSGLNLEVKFDASAAWKTEEKPEAGSTYFKAFAEDYLQKKFKGISGVGCTVTVEAGVADSRERPYKVTNHVTDKARKYKTHYEGLINGNDKGTSGTIVLAAETKSEAEQLSKDYITASKGAVNKVVVRLAKTVSDGKPVALEVAYTPSINTTLGTYIVFGYEKES